MSKKLKIGLAQINPTIGDIQGNTQSILNCLEKAKEYGVEVLAFPEMSIIGYPAQDLLFQREIIESNLYALEQIAPKTRGYMAVIVGHCKPYSKPSLAKPYRQHLYNAYTVFTNGEKMGDGEKICLPNYGVFDDFRYYIPGKDAKVFSLENKNSQKNSDKINSGRYTGSCVMGVEICEDLWYTNDQLDHPIYPFRPTKTLAQKGADFIIVLNASPYHLGKNLYREELAQKQAKENHVPIFYLNMWGANDKIIFDGNSFAVDIEGNTIARAKSFEEDLLIYDLNLETKKGTGLKPIDYEPEKDLYQALVLGKRDYHKKCGISKSVLGVSGGIDSAVTLAIDSHALGSKNVLAILSPSRYTSSDTLNDAIQICKNFDISYKIIPIEEKNQRDEWIGTIPEKYRRWTLNMGQPNNPIVFENQQAIDRMSILRAIANEENRLVSGTGNKSELAMGYATVCGDLQADILVIGDLYKRQVFALADYINQLHSKEMIPKSILKRIPSAELSENQVDPFDYDRLDQFLELRIEKYLSDQEILQYQSEHLYSQNGSSSASSWTLEEIQNYSKTIDHNEHKRFKSGYILKVSPIAFGEDRRMNTAKQIRLLTKKDKMTEKS